MTQERCAKCDDDGRQTIGRAGDTVDVYALRGGTGIDSVFQLGVAHAHIVSALPPPALIVGLSTGAVHAAAIAEILQAGNDPALPEEKRRDAQLHRFREILYAYQDFATDLHGNALPDAFEADAGRPLQPNPQAIHFDAEREARREALKARSGLIALVNDLFAQSMTIRTMTRLIRAYVGWKATAELPLFLKLRARLREGRYMLQAIAVAPLQCLRLANDYFRAYVGGTARATRQAIDQKELVTSFPALHGMLLKFIEGRHSRGYTAGQIVFGGTRPRVGRHVLMIGLAAVAVLGALGAVLFFLYREVPFLWPPVAWLVGVVLVLLLEDFHKAAVHLRKYDRSERILSYYNLLRDLGSDYMIEDLFIRIFDPAYHGKLEMTKVVARAAEHVDHAKEEEQREKKKKKANGGQKAPDPVRRTFAAYTEVEPKIWVVPFVADLATGRLEQVEAEVPIVDGLKGAVSRVPFLHPAALRDGKYCVDAANISSDAAVPANDVLRNHLHPDVKEVRLFNVMAVTPAEPPSASRRMYEGTVAVALGAMELSRFRDMGDERENIESYNELIPPDPRRPERLAGVGEPRALRCFGMENGKPVHFVRADYVEIAPREALHTTGELLREQGKEERQAIIARAVAEGCRATLAARHGSPDFGCRQIVGRWLETPGATEVCRYCTAAPVRRPPARPPVKIVTEPPASTPAQPQAIREEPTINLLFSGGVFRGVFQIGVLNALSHLEVKPNVIAGSSVGSIVAAMIARVFTRPTVEERNPEVARLAATFLTLDRLIITDRFSDFVRRFTLRAAAARFSLRDADRFFRNYDRVSGRFDSVARRVVGGIEHLFYVSPYELSDLVREIRQQKYSSAYDLACRYAQEMCDRGTVGFEVLGAEPLALLIKQHVLTEDERDRRAHNVPLSSIAGDLTFLLTATNFTRRSLDIISSDSRTGAADRRAALVEALLASSAFPGVFRPRWGREVFFGDNSLDQYIDGGVLDNLPLSAVVRYLFEAAKALRIQARPRHGRNLRLPHLVLTASLEPETVALDRAEVEHAAQSWIAARSRAQRLRYNQKIDRFRDAQRDLRYIYNRYADAPRRMRRDPTLSREQDEPIGTDTLDIEVVIVKPKWLCPTFAFHPMLGFRRRNQAGSIAHGCAATFQTIARIIEPETAEDAKTDRTWPADAWKMSVGDLSIPHARTLEPIADDRAVRMEKGLCHFRKTSCCPFSRPELEKMHVFDEAGTVRDELEMIYELCGRRETHQRPPA